MSYEAPMQNRDEDKLVKALQKAYSKPVVVHDENGAAHVVDDMDRDLFHMAMQAVPSERFGRNGDDIGTLRNLMNAADANLPARAAAAMKANLQGQIEKVKLIMASKNAETVRRGSPVSSLQDKLATFRSDRIYSVDDKVEGVLAKLTGQGTRNEPV